MCVLGGQCKRNTHAQQTETARVKDACQLLSVPTGQVDRNLGPEMGVAAIKNQPIMGAHFSLHIQ